MKIKHQMKYFINGIILLVLGFFSVTFLPIIIKYKSSFILPNYIYYEIEFFFLSAGAAFFLFAPKYYKEQTLIIILLICSYVLFARFLNAF